MNFQDFSPTNIGRGGAVRGPAVVPKDKGALASALRSGAVSTEMKFSGGSNQSIHSLSVNARKIEEAEVGRIEKVDLNLSKAIMQARMAKKMTQKELATAINEKPQIIGEYESGKAVPNPQLISKLERALNCKLPRPGKKVVEKTPAQAAAAKTSSLTRGGPPRR